MILLGKVKNQCYSLPVGHGMKHDEAPCEGIVVLPTVGHEMA